MPVPFPSPSIVGRKRLTPGGNIRMHTIKFGSEVINISETVENLLAPSEGLKFRPFLTVA